jgi:serine/threonine-protein kinase
MTANAGRTLGRYRLERLIGRGGMAEVWEARDQTLGRRVALKIILPGLAGEPRFHERFLSEARAVAALEHEHVLPIYDFGDAEGEPYLVMPFLESGTLAERLQRDDVAPAQAIEWIRQLASALDAAHAAGVLHRDVKPANVMLGGGGRLLLADFGIAKSSQSGDLTATGIALGTPAYMAPELARGEGATTASDRYALAVLAYELLCGRPPFVGDNALALLHQHLTTPVPAVSAARPDLPAVLDPVFARLLSKDPAERPPSCAALAGEIAHAFGDRPPAQPMTLGRRAPSAAGPDDATLAAPVSPAPAPTPATRAASAAARPAPTAGDGAGTAPLPLMGAMTGSAGAPRRRLPAIAAIALAMVAIGVGWWLMSAGRDRANEPTSVATEEGPASSSMVEPASTATGDDDQTPPDAGGDRASDRSPELPPPPSFPPAPGGAASRPPLAVAGRDALPDPPSAPPARASAPSSTSSGDAAPTEIDTATGNAAIADQPATEGRWAIPPAEAFAIFGTVADAWRRGRFDAALFDNVEKRAASIRANTAAPGIELLVEWIDGGQALVAGDHDRARAIAGEFLALQNPPDWVALLPMRFLARHPGTPPDWQVALFWADPRSEARRLVGAALAAAPNDRNLALAVAVVDHLDGDHAGAARRAIALEPQLRQGRPRYVVARFIGDQLLWSGDAAAAISWYKRLLIAPDRTEIGAVLRTLSQEGGPTLMARACADGFAPACESGGRSHPGPRARRARPQP